MNRHDWYWWRFHFIVRGYKDAPQYGCMLWGVKPGEWTFDVWSKQTLWTVVYQGWV